MGAEMECCDLETFDIGDSKSGWANAREKHKLAERERRKSMRELFLSLHALLPHASTVRKEQSAILDEIIKYIPLTAARLRALQNRKETLKMSRLSTPMKISYSNHNDCDISLVIEPSSSVTIRVRGDRVNVSLTDTKGTATAQPHLLSAVLDELEAYNMDLIRSTHCRNGNQLLHHSESKIRDGFDRSPQVFKARLQELACKLHKLRKCSSLRRSLDESI